MDEKEVKEVETGSLITRFRLDDENKRVPYRISMSKSESFRFNLAAAKRGMAFSAFARFCMEAMINGTNHD